MKKVYFRSYWTLYRIGNVRKDYRTGDIIRLKSMVCKLKVINATDEELHVIEY